MKFSIIHLIYLSILLSSCNVQSTSSSLQGTSNISDSVTKMDTVVSKMAHNPTIIFQDSQNNYWFGVRGQGVYKYDNENLILYSKEDGLCSKEIIGIQEDQFGNLYFDTHEGVSRFDGQQFTTLEVHSSDSSKNEWMLTPTDLWFTMGWNKSGPFRYDGHFLYPLEFPKTEQVDKFYATYPDASFNPAGIYSLYKDSKGNVWFGTASLGVCRYDGEKISWLYEEQMTTTPSGGAFGIRSILEDEKGCFWFTNTRYCYHILSDFSEQNGTNYINYRKENGVGYTNENKEIAFPYYLSIVEEKDGDLWMATYDEGVWRNNGQKLIRYPIKDGDKTVLIFSIYKDRKGVLWLATHNAGVYKYNGKAFEKFAL